MSYPLTLRFKKIALARQFSVEDASGRLLMYVKQKAFMLKEAITIYADREQTRPLYRVQADRIIDFSATYNITNADGTHVGAVRQRGMKSFWRARYDMMRGNEVVFSVREENPWAKVGDGLLSEVPLLAIFSGYFFHPRYLVSLATGQEVIRARKESSFLESTFTVERLPAQLSPDDERLVLIGTAVTVLLERRRG